MTESRYNGPLAQLLRRSFARGAPDPWPNEVDDAIRADDAVPLCIDCLGPVVGHHWFCPHCGHPAGDFVMLMPYLQIFPQAEVLRRGVIGPPERDHLKTAGFVLYSITQYSVFAPLYWYWMARKAAGHPICEAKRKIFPVEDGT